MRPIHHGFGVEFVILVEFDSHTKFEVLYHIVKRVAYPCTGPKKHMLMWINMERINHLIYVLLRIRSMLMRVQGKDLS